MPDEAEISAWLMAFFSITGGSDCNVWNELLPQN